MSAFIPDTYIAAKGNLPADFMKGGISEVEKYLTATQDAITLIMGGAWLCSFRN